MENELDKVVEKLVCERYGCKKCIFYKKCSFFVDDGPKECGAKDFSEGIHALAEYLCTVPLDELIKILVSK